MELPIILIILISPLGLIFFFRHIKIYKDVISTLKSRGIDVSLITTDLSDYGSSGAIKKINKILLELKSTLSDEEKNLLLESKKYYNLQALIVVPVVALMFWGILGS